MPEDTKTVEVHNGSNSHNYKGDRVGTDALGYLLIYSEDTIVCAINPKYWDKAYVSGHRIPK